MPSGRIGYELLRHLNPDTAPGLAALSAPSLGFNYLGRFDAAPGGGTVSAKGDAVRGGHDLHVHAVDVNAVTVETAAGPTLSATWSWAAGHVIGDDVRRLAELWFTALRAVIDHAR